MSLAHEIPEKKSTGCAKTINNIQDADTCMFECGRETGLRFDRVNGVFFAQKMVVPCTFRVRSVFRHDVAISMSYLFKRFQQSFLRVLESDKTVLCFVGSDSHPFNSIYIKTQFQFKQKGKNAKTPKTTLFGATLVSQG